MKYKKLSKTARAPTRGSEGAAGWDLYADINGAFGFLVIEPGDTVLIPTGIALDISPGYFGALYARSGLATKQGLRPATGVSVIDQDYKGELLVPLYNDSKESRVVQNGERIVQIVFQPYNTDDLVEVDELGTTKRGDGGFGSTGV